MARSDSAPWSSASFGFAALLLVACSSDDTDPSPPRGPEDFAIAAVGTVSERLAESGGALTLDCNEPLFVWMAPEVTNDSLGNVKFGDFFLEPPGRCGENVDCGWIVIEVAASAGGVEPLVVEAAQSPIEVNIPSALREGSLTLRASMRDSSGQMILTGDGKDLQSEFVVELTCVAAPPANP